MTSFSVKCRTLQEAADFGRLMKRLGFTWSLGRKFTQNNCEWCRYKDKTHYNIKHPTYITYGSFDEHIRYTLVDVEAIKNARSIEELNDIIIRIKEDRDNE